MTRVLRPSLARLSHSSWMQPLQIGLQRSTITMSAPFRYRMILSVAMCLTMMPIRLVSLEKGKFARIQYFSVYQLGMLITMSFLLLSSRMKPNSSANFTRAISSGLEACSTRTPSSMTGVTLLHRIKAVAKSLCRNYCLLLAFFLSSQGSCKSPSGPENFLQALVVPFLSSSMSSTEQRVQLIDTFLKTMSLQVSVPVLSLSRYSILPNYYGMELLRQTVSGSSSSFEILQLKQALQKSKLTRRLMGMIEASRSTYLKKQRGQYRLNSLKTFITRARINIKRKRIFERQLTSSSKRPILVLGYLEFMLALVYRPVKMTSPVMWPAAMTVFAQAVLSRPRGQRLFSPEKEPTNSQMSSQAGAQMMLESAKVANLSWARMAWVVLMALLTFQSVSPSSWSVLMKIDPVGSEVDSTTMSAGTLYLAWSSMMSPTLMSSDLMVRTCPCLSSLYLDELLSQSLLYLLQSSQAYLARVRVMTSTRGDRQLKRKPTLRMGTSWLRLMASWKKLKNSLNWLKSTRGRKLSTLYFWLLTALDIVFYGSLLPSSHTCLSTAISSPPQQEQQNSQRQHRPTPLQHPPPLLNTWLPQPISAYEPHQSLILISCSPREPSSEGLRSWSSMCFYSMRWWSSMPEQRGLVPRPDIFK